MRILRRRRFTKIEKYVRRAIGAADYDTLREQFGEEAMRAFAVTEAQLLRAKKKARRKKLGRLISKAEKELGAAARAEELARRHEAVGGTFAEIEEKDDREIALAKQYAIPKERARMAEDDRIRIKYSPISISRHVQSGKAAVTQVGRPVRIMGWKKARRLLSRNKYEWRLRRLMDIRGVTYKDARRVLRDLKARGLKEYRLLRKSAYWKKLTPSQRSKIRAKAKYSSKQAVDAFARQNKLDSP